MCVVAFYNASIVFKREDLHRITSLIPDPRRGISNTLSTTSKFYDLRKNEITLVHGLDKGIFTAFILFPEKYF